MRKILFLVTQSEFGGAQRYIYEVSRTLAERYEILVAAGEGDGELFGKLENTRVQPVYLREMRRTPWPWQIILAIKEIYNILKKERPDVLFLCSTTAGLLGSVAGFFYRFFEVRPPREVGPRIIYRIGGWAFNDPRPRILNQIILWAEKITAPLKDLIIVNSEYDWRIAVKKRIVSPEKIIKIYNGLDPDSLNFLTREEARARLCARLSRAQPTRMVLVGTVANFYKTKGLEYLIRALSRLSLLGRLSLIIIGEGKERPKLEALIKKYNLENQVSLAGRISDAYKYLKAFNVFVLPSLKEGFPWIILEAMAAELPIVATEVGALPEIIDDGINGCLAKPSNSQALSEKIKWLLENPQEAKVMGIQAKAKLVKEFSLQRMIEETEKLFS